MIENRIGLEFEFLLRDKKGNLVFPENKGFETDDFPILGECRVKSASTPEKCLGNFFESYYRLKKRVEKKGLVLDLTGFAEIDNAFNAKVLKAMGTKIISESKNIKGTKILELNDSIIKDKTVWGRYISCGLHIHFSSEEKQILSNKKYEEVNLHWLDKPLPFKVYQPTNQKNEEGSIRISRITMPVLLDFVKDFDKKILPNYKYNFNLKFRMPGYYEIKSYGFEYRSLPFNEKILEDIDKIVYHAFKKLNELKIK